MAYVDGFVIPVPKAKVDSYRALAKIAAKVWIEHGALECRECIAEDVKPGKVTSFPQSVNLKPSETVIFSYIVYRNRAQRDRVMAKVMADPRLKDMMGGKDMPFDGQRMIFGGFDTMLHAAPKAKVPTKAEPKKAPAKKTASRGR